MDQLQTPGVNKKRQSAESLPGQKRRPAKQTKKKVTGDLPGTYLALNQSTSRSSFNSSSAFSNQTARVPSGKNAKAGSSTDPNSRDLFTPTRVSSRVSRPTFKKKALLITKSRSPESDGTPPISIIPPAPPPSLKRKKPTSSTKRTAANNTPSKSNWLDPNPIELTSSEDERRPRPPQKRVKRTHTEPFNCQIIDLCSESEDATASSSPRRPPTRDEESVPVVLSADAEVVLKSPGLDYLASRETNIRESPAPPPLRDISSPIEFESLCQTSPSYSPVPNTNTPVVEDSAADENNLHAEKANFPRSALQALYDEALGHCAREPPRAEDIADQPSPFSSLKYVPQAQHVIRYPTETPSPSLHTSLFFDRITLLRARLKQPKTFVNTSPNSMQASKLNEQQEDSLTRPDTVVAISTVDIENPEVTTKTIVAPPIDFEEFQALKTLVDAFTSPPFANQEAETSLVCCAGRTATIQPVVLEDAQFFVQALQQKYDALNVSEFSLNPALKLDGTTNPSVALEPLSTSVVGHAMVTNTSSTAISSSVHPSSTSKWPFKPSLTLPDPIMRCISPFAISSTEDVSSPLETPKVLVTEQATTLDLPSPAGPSSKDVSSGLEYLSESRLASSSSTNALSSRKSSPSTRSLHSSFFDIDVSEINLQTLIGKFDEDDDDDVSISGMELTYPDELHTI